MISRPFWRYSDPYSSPYFVPSQEPAFRPVSYLRTRFGSQDAVSDPSPPAHYFRISGLPRVLFPLAPPTRRLNHPISTLSLTRSFRAPTPLFNPDVQCLDFRLSVAMRATSYFGTIDSHDHYVSRPSRFRAATSQCRSLLPNLAIRFPQLIQFTTFRSPELNPVPLFPSELSDSV